MQTLVTHTPAYAWGMLGIIFALAGVICFGAWALSRRVPPTGPLVTRHPYRRQRTVLVAVDRRRGAAPPARLTAEEARQLVEDWRAAHPQVADAWRTGAMS